MPIRERISAIYHFVRDEVLFGYHRDDAIPADEVLKDRYGQCNTKTILFYGSTRRCGNRVQASRIYHRQKIAEGSADGERLPFVA